MVAVLKHGINHLFLTDSRLFFLFIGIIYVWAAFLLNSFVLTDMVYHNTLGEQLAYERIEEILIHQLEWEWLHYILQPIFVFIKIGLIALCLNIGAVLMEYKITFSKIFSIVVQAEIIFALAALLEAIILWIWLDVQHLDDIRGFYLLSLITLFDITQIEAWMIYLLRTINFLEVLYILLLSMGIGWFLQKKFSESLAFVIGTYGLGLVTWVVFITFLQLNLN